MKSLAEIADRWTVFDLLDANIAIDLWDEIERLAQKKAEARRRSTK